MAVSDYGVSVRGSVGISEAGSLRGSTRQSVTESVYASSEIMEDESLHASNKKEDHVIAVSSIEDDSMVAALVSVALKLPFNLLNL